MGWEWWTLPAFPSSDTLRVPGKYDSNRHKHRNSSQRLLPIQMLKVGAWEVAQTVKCLPCKCEDRCLVPITHIKSLGVAVQYKSSAMEVETGTLCWGSLVR